VEVGTLAQGGHLMYNRQEVGKISNSTTALKPIIARLGFAGEISQPLSKSKILDRDVFKN